MIAVPIFFSLCAVALTWYSTWGCNLFDSDYFGIQFFTEENIVTQSHRGYGVWTVTGLTAVSSSVDSSGVTITAYRGCYAWDADLISFFGKQDV